MSEDFSFNNLLPESGKILLTGKGQEFIKRVGIESVRKAVLGIMRGENLRTQTEFLTRNRLCQLSASLIILYLNGVRTKKNFSDNLFSYAVDQIANSKKSDHIAQWPAMWFIGMTEKQFQNVLGSDRAKFDEYAKRLKSTLDAAVDVIKKDFGNLKMELGYFEGQKSKQVIELSWQEILQLAIAIGSQTLAVRGSEKSMYGKLFERLVLGTTFSLLGFKFVLQPETCQYERAGYFWLSDSTKNRESDGTIAYAPWKIARFDIGFIGKGNPEITKDKLSRFSLQESIRGKSVSSKTFIIIDKMPTTLKTTDAAKQSGTEIIQMSMSFWIRNLAQRMNETLGFRHPIQKMNDTQLRAYLETEIAKLDLLQFLPKTNQKSSKQ